MKRTTFMRGLGVMAIATFLLALGTRTPASVSADPVQPQPATMSWDGVKCVSPMDLGGTVDPDVCTNENGNPTYEDTDSSGTISVGDAVEMASTYWVDVDPADNPNYPPGDPEEGFPDLGTGGWNGGIVAHPGGTIELGDEIGEYTFVISSNLSSPMTNNVDLSDGQPPACVIADTSPPKIGPTTFKMYNAAWKMKPQVSHLDTDGDGKAQTREDNLLPDGSPGKNGIYDGADLMPAGMADLIISIGLPTHSFIQRGFGVAQTGLGSEADVNILTYDLRVWQTEGDLVAPSFIDISVVGYPGAGQDPATAANVTSQTVMTCPPYLSGPARSYGLTVGNNTPCFGCAGSPAPNITGGVVNRSVVEEGTFDSYIQISLIGDYDGDGLNNGRDLCDISDTAPVGPDGDKVADDTDGDGLTGVCDTNGEGTDVNDPPGTNPGPYNMVPPWSAGQDVDGDTFLNSTDNCPNDANGTAGDVQTDTDGDGLGDVCDADPNVDGDGNGYTGAGTFQDTDNVCNDQFVIPSASEPAGEAGSGVAPKKECIAALTKATANPDQLYSNPPMYHVLRGDTTYDLTSVYLDTDDDGTADWLPAVVDKYGDADLTTDSDDDGHSDACEGYNGTDALDPNDSPDPPAVPGSTIPGVGGDCDGGFEYDAAEWADDTDITNAADDIPGVDVDGDGCGDAQEAAVMGYSHNNALDFFDVPVPANADPTPNGPRNQAVALTDVLAVLFYVGTQDVKTTPNANGVVYNSDKNADTMPDGRDYDRTVSPTPNPPWDAGDPDGAVAIPDVLVNLAQVPMNCIGSRPGATPVDIEVSEVRLTKNGVVQAPGSTVTFTSSDYLDIQVVEIVNTGPDPLIVDETVILRGRGANENPPPGSYHCLNEDQAIVKAPVPLEKREQFCTFEHIRTPASQTWEDPAMIDAEVTWELALQTQYTKTVNLIDFGVGTPPRMFELLNAASGSYDIEVCAREDPDEPKLYVDTDTSNNFKCESYTLVIP